MKQKSKRSAAPPHNSISTNSLHNHRFILKALINHAPLTNTQLLTLDRERGDLVAATSQESGRLRLHRHRVRRSSRASKFGSPDGGRICGVRWTLVLVILGSEPLELVVEAADVGLALVVAEDVAGEEGRVSRVEVSGWSGG